MLCEKLLQESTQFLQDLNKTHDNLEFATTQLSKSIQEMERVVKSIVKTLDTKIAQNLQQENHKLENPNINPRFREQQNLEGENESEKNQTQNIELFSQQALKTIQTMKETHLTINNFISAANFVKLPSFLTHKEITFNAKQLFQIQNKIDETRFIKTVKFIGMVDNELQQSKYMALQTVQQVTINDQIVDQERMELYEIYRENKQSTQTTQIGSGMPFKAVPIISVNKKITIAMTHGDRFIFDNQIFQQTEKGEFIRIQEISLEEVSGGLALNSNLIIFGHPSYARFTVFKWNGQQYERLQRKPMVCGGAFHQHNASLFQKNIFSDLPNEIYVVFGGRGLYRIILNGKDVSRSEKFRVKQKRLDIIDYHQIEARRMVISYADQILVIDPLTRAKIISKPLAFIHQSIQILPPKFSLAYLPVMLVKENECEYQVVDLNSTGYQGIVNGLYNITILGIIKKCSDQSFIECLAQCDEIVKNENGESQCKILVIKINIS